jgi:CheY-like chemotaxis protein
VRVTVERFDVESPFAERHSLAPGAAVRIVVEDDGAGMTPDVLDRAFEPFFTTKPIGRGSGLGLSIVHGIVAKHRGLVLASSRIGAGTRFEVYLPARAPSVLPAAADSEPPPGDRKRRILCVDDEPAVLRVLAQVLQRAGHVVTTVASSPEALRIVQARPAEFDLVITDQTMPELTGLELAARVCEVRRDIPIILLSAYAETDWVKSATPNVRSFLRKPFDALELARAIQLAPS